MITVQSLFALRVAAAMAMFLVYILLLQEATIRGAMRRFDLAFFLALSCSGLSLGMLAALAWHAAYVFTVVSGQDARWMLNSSFVVGYVVVILLSSMALMHSLTLSRSRTIACASIIILTGIVSYLWIGGRI